MSMQMDLIVTSTDGTVPSLDVTNISADLEKKMSVTHADELIERLCQDKWMSKVSVVYSAINQNYNNVILW